MTNLPPHLSAIGFALARLLNDEAFQRRLREDDGKARLSLNEKNIRHSLVTLADLAVRITGDDRLFWYGSELLTAIRAAYRKAVIAFPSPNEVRDVADAITDRLVNFLINHR